MAEHVGAAGDADLGEDVLGGLLEAGEGEGAADAGPDVVSVAESDEGGDGGGHDGDGALPGLAGHEKVVAADVGPAEAGDFSEAEAGVEEDLNEGAIAAGELEAEDAGELVVGEGVADAFGEARAADGGHWVGDA